MEDYINAFKVCVSHPIEIMTLPISLIIFIAVELVTVAIASLFYKKHGCFMGITKISWIFVSVLIIGYIIAFIIVIIFIVDFTHSNIIP